MTPSRRTDRRHLLALLASAPLCICTLAWASAMSATPATTEAAPATATAGIRFIDRYPSLSYALDPAPIPVA